MNVKNPFVDGHFRIIIIADWKIDWVWASMETGKWLRRLFETKSKLGWWVPRPRSWQYSWRAGGRDTEISIRYLPIRGDSRQSPHTSASSISISKRGFSMHSNNKAVMINKSPEPYSHSVRSLLSRQRTYTPC